MNVTPPIRYALLAVAAALLVVGLQGPVRRTLDEREQAQKAQALAEQVARERAEATERFKANRAQLMGDMRAAMARSDYREVLRLAAPFGAVPDEELRELYRDAARAESQNQRVRAYAELVARECDEVVAGNAIRAIFATVPEAVGRPEPPTRLVRLAPEDARPVALARMREPPPREHAHAAGSALPPPSPPPPADWVATMRAQHRARLLPDFLGFVLSPFAGDIICVWRAEGRRRADGRTFAYTLDLWLAPALDLKGVTPDVAAWREASR